jgi:hypothetical protein
MAGIERIRNPRLVGTTRLVARLWSSGGSSRRDRPRWSERNGPFGPATGRRHCPSGQPAFGAASPKVRESQRVVASRAHADPHRRWRFTRTE